MVCQGTHILERYRWKILKLSQINGHILGFNPMILSSLEDFVYPRSFSAAVCQVTLKKTGKNRDSCDSDSRNQYNPIMQQL